MKKSNYKLVEDNYYSSIEKTEDEVDNYDVFKTLPQAKRKLIANMKQEIDNYKRAIKRVKSITPDNLYGTFMEKHNNSNTEKANALAKVVGLHENYYETLEEATSAALDRSLFTNRVIYIFSIERLFMVCAHGVERVGHTLVRRCQYGSIL